MNVDTKIEIIRKALEAKHGNCSVNRGHLKATFFINGYLFQTISKQFIEVLPLVDMEATRGLIEHMAGMLKTTENQPLVDKKEK